MKIEKKSNEAIIEPIEDNWNWLDELGEPDPTFNYQHIKEFKRVPLLNYEDWLAKIKKSPNKLSGDCEIISREKHIRLNEYPHG
ncbi:cell division protein ZipA [Glaesserella parasuis]|uniref:cell division protein ZipA n=1 Tax=Glaesserella parasuis TaxID=738 RepID=UPI0024367481|nr:cell division protein ZipA [Glaesserella parasuis]MDG6816468.1 cell division protein ZipA [Glaesserella parasuis]